MKLSRPAIRKCSVFYGDHDEANENIILDVRKKKKDRSVRQTNIDRRPDGQTEERSGWGGGGGGGGK